MIGLVDCGICVTRLGVLCTAVVAGGCLLLLWWFPATFQVVV